MNLASGQNLRPEGPHDFSLSKGSDKPQASGYSVFDRISAKDLVFFSRELSILLNASVPIVQSLRVLSKQISNKKLRAITQEVASSVEAGSSLSAALAQFPQVFDFLFVSLVRTGEISGTLDRSLNYIADQNESDFDLRRKLKSALTYPIFVIVAMAAVISILFIFVMPKMLAMVQESNAELPLTTKILIATTAFFTGYWWLVLGLIIGALIVFRYIISKPRGELWWATAKMKIPIIGPTLKKFYLERFARNFSILIKGGIPMVQAIQITADAVGSSAYRSALMDAADKVENGQSVTAALAEHPQRFPDTVIEMIDIGEQTSKMEDILTKIAEFYGKEAEQSVDSLTQLLEPTVMIILGVVVAIIVSGVLLPIYSLVNAQ